MYRWDPSNQSPEGHLRDAEEVAGTIRTELPDWTSDRHAPAIHVELKLLPVSLPLSPVPRALLADYCRDRRDRRRRNMKEIWRSVLTDEADDSQTESPGGLEQDWSEDDLMKVSRKVERKNMKASQACQLYGIPYQKFLEFETLHSKHQRRSPTGIVTSVTKREPSSLKPKILPYDIVKKEIFEDEENSYLRPSVGGLEGWWTSQYLEELEDNTWTYTPVKKIKLEKKNIYKINSQIISN